MGINATKRVADVPTSSGSPRIGHRRHAVIGFMPFVVWMLWLWLWFLFLYFYVFLITTDQGVQQVDNIHLEGLEGVKRHHDDSLGIIASNGKRSAIGADSGRRFFS